jgi:uncharacterized membrane protein HdeD (DUF308 family)
MFQVFSRYWWAFLGRGLFAILYVIFAIAWPGITGADLFLLFGAYVFIDGLILAFKALRNWNAQEERWLLLIEGLLGIGIGSLSVIVSRITVQILFFYLVAWSLATGVLKIVGAIRLRKEMAGEWWLLMSGCVSVLFAFLLMAFFEVGTVGLAYIITVYAILYGIMLMILSFKLRQARKSSQPV